MEVTTTKCVTIKSFMAILGFNHVVYSGDGNFAQGKELLISFPHLIFFKMRLTLKRKGNLH